MRGDAEVAAAGDQTGLLDGLRRGDPTAFSEAFERFGDPVYRLALGLLREPSDAEDVVQEVFLALLEKIETFEGRSRLETWLYRVAYNAALMRLRKRSHAADSYGATFDDQPGDLEAAAPRVLADWRETPEAVLVEAELSQTLREAVDSLPEPLRVAVVLRDVDGLSTAEAAEVLDISAGALKVRLHRARLALRERLSERFAAEVPTPEPVAPVPMCWDVLRYISDYIDRDLDEALRKDIALHIETCQNCHILVSTTHRTILLYREDAIRVVPAAERRAGAFDRLAAAFERRRLDGPSGETP